MRTLFAVSLLSFTGQAQALPERGSIPTAVDQLDQAHVAFAGMIE